MKFSLKQTPRGESDKPCVPPGCETEALLNGAPLQQVIRFQVDSRVGDVTHVTVEFLPSAVIIETGAQITLCVGDRTFRVIEELPVK